MKQERFYDYWTIRVKRIEKLKRAVSPLLFCACWIEGEIWVFWGLAFGRIVDEVKLEMIGTVMNFLCILQGQLSFMVAYGVTCNACYVECKGRKGFLNWHGNCTLLTPKISPVSVILLNECSFGFFCRDWQDFCKWIGWCDFSPCFRRVSQKISLHFPLQLHSKTLAITQPLLCLKGLEGVPELFSVFQTVKLW